jgi:hypothetical protein
MRNEKKISSQNFHPEFDQEQNLAPKIKFSPIFFCNGTKIYGFNFLIIHFSTQHSLTTFPYLNKQIKRQDVMDTTNLETKDPEETTEFPKFPQLYEEMFVTKRGYLTHRWHSTLVPGEKTQTFSINVLHKKKSIDISFNEGFDDALWTSLNRAILNGRHPIPTEFMPVSFYFTLYYKKKYQRIHSPRAVPKGTTMPSS